MSVGCANELDDQQHLFYCSVLSENTVMSDNVRYEDIFQQKDFSKQQQVVNIIFEHLKKKKQNCVS